MRALERASRLLARQRSRQAELREDAAVAEPGDRRDLLALKRQDEHRAGPRDLGLGGWEVDAECWLGVRASRHEERRAAPHRAVAQERADRHRPLILVGLGRHRQPGVVGEQGDDGVDVARLDRVGEAADDVAFALGARERRPLTSAGGKARVERGARAAQQAVDRRLSRREQFGDLRGAEPEHVAQHEHGALLRREVLQADDERQRDRLLRLVARLRAGRVVGDAVEQDVRIRLQPDRLAVAGRLGHLGHRLALLRAAPARAQGVQRAVGGDAIQPGTDRRALLVVLQPAPRGEQRLLQQILGILRRADDPVDVQLQLTPVGVGQVAERRLVAGARASERLLGHARILAPTCITSADVAAGRTRRSILRAADASTAENTNQGRPEMGKIVLSGPQNVSLDGVVQDPDGQEGFSSGGWFVQFGGADLAEWSKVALDEALRAEAGLLGRRSYEFFAMRWRPRSGELADRLNSMPKYVVSSTLEDPDWSNSTVLT